MGRVFAPDEVLPLRVDVALIRRLAVRHHHANRAAQMLLVEAECFGAPAGEIHIRVHLHAIILHRVVERSGRKSTERGL
jgi:hypothetical protein